MTEDCTGANGNLRATKRMRYVRTVYYILATVLRVVCVSFRQFFIFSRIEIVWK